MAVLSYCCVIIFFLIGRTEAEYVNVLGSQSVCWDSKYYNQSTIVNPPLNGILAGIELDHIRGGITCETGLVSGSKWGCVSTEQNVYTFFVRITNAANYTVQQYYPTNVTNNVTHSSLQWNCRRVWDYYNMSTDSYDPNSPILRLFKPSYYAQTSQRFMVVNSEAMCQRSIANNNGSVCAKLYFIYTKTDDLLMQSGVDTYHIYIETAFEYFNTSAIPQYQDDLETVVLTILQSDIETIETISINFNVTNLVVITSTLEFYTLSDNDFTFDNNNISSQMLTIFNNRDDNTSYYRNITSVTNVAITLYIDTNDKSFSQSFNGVIIIIVGLIVACFVSVIIVAYIVYRCVVVPNDRKSELDRKNLQTTQSQSAHVIQVGEPNTDICDIGFQPGSPEAENDCGMDANVAQAEIEATVTSGGGNTQTKGKKKSTPGKVVDRRRYGAF